MNEKKSEPVLATGQKKDDDATRYARGVVTEDDDEGHLSDRRRALTSDTPAELIHQGLTLRR